MFSLCIAVRVTRRERKDIKCFNVSELIKVGGAIDFFELASQYSHLVILKISNEAEDTESSGEPVALKLGGLLYTSMAMRHSANKL